jgi:hypothetical protein
VWGASLSPVADVEHVSWDSDPTNERGILWLWTRKFSPGRESDDSLA